MKYLKYDVRSLSQSGEKINVSYGLQHLMSIKHSDPITQKEWELLLESLIVAEKACPRSAEIMMELLKGHDAIHQRTPHDLSSIDDYFRFIGLSNKNVEMLIEVMEHSTVDTVITVHDSHSNKDFIEFVTGHRFDLKPALSRSNKTYKKPRIVCIDGFIENVSEVHNLFTELSERKSECFLMCRGFSNDVLHTIQVNNDRGTLSIRPYVVPYDLDHANTLVDLAVVSGGDVVSSLKGDLISTVGLGKTGIVDEVLEFKDSILIKSSHHDRIRLHVERLKKERQEKSDAMKFIDERLRSLNSSSVRIFICNDVHGFETRRQLDLGIRIIGFIAKNCYEPYQIAKMHHESYVRLTSNMFTRWEEEGNINLEEAK